MFTKLEFDIHWAANAPWRLHFFYLGPSVVQSSSVADSRRVCSYCAAPTCECNCNCMNMKQNLAENDHRGLFDFSGKKKGHGVHLFGTIHQISTTTTQGHKNVQKSACCFIRGVCFLYLVRDIYSFKPSTTLLNKPSSRTPGEKCVEHKSSDNVIRLERSHLSLPSFSSRYVACCSFF